MMKNIASKEHINKIETSPTSDLSSKHGSRVELQIKLKYNKRVFRIISD